MSGSRLGRRMRMATLGLALLLALGAGAHAIVWWRATVELERQAARWVAARAGEGIAVRHGTAVRGGWPFAATLRLPRVLAEARTPDGPATLSAEAVVLVLRAAEPDRLHVRFEGPIGFAAESGAVAVAARIEAALLALDLPLRRGGPEDAARFSARALVIESGGARLAARDAELLARRDPLARGEAPAVSLLLDLAEVTLPPAWNAGLGPRIARAGIDLQLVGQLPAAGSPQAQARAWRDGGGFVQVPRLLLDWGPLSLAADATLALDDALQPSGAGRARVGGMAPTLDALAANGAITREAAQAGRAMVAFLQRTPAGGGAPVIDLPLVLQDRALRAGRLTLLRLPPIDLPR